MGADAFIGFYGIEESLSPEEIKTLELRTDDRIKRARAAGLQFHFGRVTDGRDYHLLIGRKIANLGVEGDEEAAYSDAEWQTIQSAVREKLKDAGFPGEPKVILKLEAQY
jgi:hypothetical protein